jgi:hypothetical protein
LQLLPQLLCVLIGIRGLLAPLVHVVRGALELARQLLHMARQLVLTGPSSLLYLHSSAKLSTPIPKIATPDTHAMTARQFLGVYNGNFQAGSSLERRGPRPYLLHALLCLLRSRLLRRDLLLQLAQLLGSCLGIRSATLRLLLQLCH